MWMSFKDGWVDELTKNAVEQKPIGMVVQPYGERHVQVRLYEQLPVDTKLYAAPVRTKDLTDDEINELWNTALMIADPTAGNLRFKFARAVIAAHKDKQK